MTLLEKADKFAEKAHQGQKRKSTGEDYIVHPREVAQILKEMGASEIVQVAGLLHDTLEDTTTTIGQLKNLFGDEVLRIVQSESEDKSKTWEQRKAHTIAMLPRESKAVKMVCLADKLSNVRSLYAEEQRQGSKLWDLFKRGKDKQGWYYCGICEALKSLHMTKAWQEYNELCNKLFK